MVSPQLRVGDTADTKFDGPVISTVEGEASSSSAAAASTYNTVHGGEVYRVSESYYGQERSDDVYRSLADGTGRRYDVIVVLDELKASELGHMSLFGYFELGLSIEGKVYERDALRFEGERP